MESDVRSRPRVESENETRRIRRKHGRLSGESSKRKEQLDEMIAKLTDFIGGTIFVSLPDVERSRLSIQLQHMNGYSEILGQRIAAF